MKPPSNRTSAWAGVTEGAKAGKLRLPVCKDCGANQYPPQEFCAACLSDDLEWTLVNPAGRVIAHTDIHASVEPWFQERAPVGVALVELECGALVYAFSAPLEQGAKIKIEARLDEAGHGVLHTALLGESE